MARNRKTPAPGPSNALPFEKPIEDVRARLEELESLASQTSHDLSEEIEFYRTRLERLTREIYSGLNAWNRVQVARHPDRPLTADYLERLCSEFLELRGDGFFGDDRALVTGLATIGGRKVMVVGHRKGRTTRTRLERNFGSAHPEGYRKAKRKMKLAEQLQLPILALVNTPGAYPGVAAEERGQARAIAENIYGMFALRVPILVLILGEGGSGGALGIAVGDRIGMLENAWYSVISPEGCASILWKSADGKERAAEALKLTAEDLLALGLIDAVIPEPVGGAHRQPDATLAAVKVQILDWLEELGSIPIEDLLEQRHRKFREIGQRAAGLFPSPAPPGSGEALLPAGPEAGPARAPLREDPPRIRQKDPDARAESGPNGGG
ncbi:MAG: acetyl-CoA carboxylase carboxyltransferase subunit alpha [Planctomycetota bacterium]